MMKTSDSFKKCGMLAMLTPVSLLVVSCGSFQGATYHDNDGIYKDDIVYYDDEQPVRSSANTTQKNAADPYYENYFEQKEQFLESIEQQMKEGDVFTDIDEYASEEITDSTDVVQDLNYNYRNGNAGWGDNPSSTVVNVYSNNWGWNGWGLGWGWGWNAGWGWGGWYGPGWGAGWGWGGWYDPFWGPGWGWGWNAGWGWGGWYGPGWIGRPYYGYNYARAGSRRNGYSSLAGTNFRTNNGNFNRGYSNLNTSTRRTRITDGNVVNRRGYSNRSNISTDRRASGSNSGYVPSDRARNYRYNNSGSSTSGRNSTYSGNSGRRGGSYSAPSSSGRSSGSYSSGGGSSRSSGGGGGGGRSGGGGGRRGGN